MTLKYVLQCWVCDQMEEYFLANKCTQAATNVNVNSCGHKYIFVGYILFVRVYGSLNLSPN